MIHRHSLYTALIVAFIATSAGAARAAEASPEALMTQYNIPGMQLVVVDHGKVTTDAAFGVKNIRLKSPVDVHTRFEIGSITKQFTAAAILQLKNRGKLSLDDRLAQYVPQYEAARDVTIRQLLLQISGIPDYTEMKAFNRLVTQRNGTVILSRNGSFDDILAMLQSAKLNFVAGTKWQYSNSNYVILGRIVELVSKMPWNRYVAKNIFAPAGMTESSFMENEANISDIATGYTHDKGTLVPTGTFIGWAQGAGAIVSTARDLAKWDEALFNGKIIKAGDVQLMTSPGALPALGGHYGFGWVIDTYLAQDRVWHNGGTLGFTAANVLYPSLHQAIIVLDNEGNAPAERIAEAEFDQSHPDLAATKTVPSAGEDPAITSRAQAIFGSFQKGEPDRTQFGEQMNAALTPAVVAQAKQNFAPLGPATSWIYRGSQKSGLSTQYHYHVIFPNDVSLEVYMTIADKDRKILGYYAQP